MQVYGANALVSTTASPGVRRTTGGTFKLASEGTQAAAAIGTVRSVSGIDALIALQGVEDGVERRKRAVRRGRSALDALDDLKLELLSGTLDPAGLRRLQAAAGELAGDSGDPSLDAVLSEIRLRVEVELAKAGVR
jgi:hypothetical protein